MKNLEALIDFSGLRACESDTHRPIAAEDLLALRGVISLLLTEARTTTNAHASVALAALAHAITDSAFTILGARELARIGGALA